MNVLIISAKLGKSIGKATGSTFAKHHMSLSICAINDAFTVLSFAVFVVPSALFLKTQDNNLYTFGVSSNVFPNQIVMFNAVIYFIYFISL